MPRIGRGLAAGDLDNDGRIDLVIVAQDGPLALFHNRSGGDRPAGALRDLAPGRDGVEPRRRRCEVVVDAGGRRQTAQRVGGGSYQSANDPRLHFGLGTAASIDEVEVRWPSGRVDRYRDLAADTGYHLREGDPRPRPLKGFQRSALIRRGAVMPGSSADEEGMDPSRGAGRVLATLAVATVVAAQAWWQRRELGLARAEIERGEFVPALRRLESLAATRPTLGRWRRGCAGLLAGQLPLGSRPSR